jgi:hypothetical protein
VASPPSPQGRHPSARVVQHDYWLECLAGAITTAGFSSQLTLPASALPGKPSCSRAVLAMLILCMLSVAASTLDWPSHPWLRCSG